MEFKVVDYKIYKIDTTREQYREKAIKYNYASKNKNWADDFYGMIDKKYSGYSDEIGAFSENKRLIKTVFVGDKYDINKDFYDKCKEPYYNIVNSDFREYGDDLTDEIIKAKFEVVKPNKPTTYPKYNNEVKFNYDKKNVIIEKIYFDGYQWQYKLKNIGHVYDYISETTINKYN